MYSQWTLIFFFFNDTATTEIYTLSLHDALPISVRVLYGPGGKESERRIDYTGQKPPKALVVCMNWHRATPTGWPAGDRKSTRLNSSHANISYAVFCLKKNKQYVFLV